MLTVHKIAIYVAFVLLTAWLVLGSWHSSHNFLSFSQYRNAATEEHGARHDAAKEKEKTDEALARYTWWLTFFTCILAFATVGLGVATIGLYLTGEKQIGVAEKAANAAAKSADHVATAERPYIFGGFGRRRYEIEPDLSEFFVATVTMANYGRTPGFLKRIEVGTGKLGNLPEDPAYENEFIISDLYFPGMTMADVRETRAFARIPADGNHVVFQPSFMKMFSEMNIIAGRSIVSTLRFLQMASTFSMSPLNPAALTGLLTTAKPNNAMLPQMSPRQR